MKEPFTHCDKVVPPHHPRALLEAAAGQGAARVALLDGTGITEQMLADPDARFSYLQFGRLTKNAFSLTGNAALGLDYGRSMRPSHLGMLGLAVMSSATVGAALSVALRHYRTLSPAWDLSLTVVADRAKLTARETLSMSPFVEFATEGLLMAFVVLGETLYGGPLPFRALCLPYARPAYAERYRELVGFEPSFEAGGPEAEFDAALLHAPIAGADPVTAALAEQYCDEQAPTSPGNDGLVARARRVLAGTHGEPPDLEHLAETLKTSPRALRRSLHELSTSYSELLEDSRRTRADQWVRATAMTFEQIAYELGFSNVRSFRRAFKRWTGDTPGAARSAALGGQPLRRPEPSQAGAANED